MPKARAVAPPQAGFLDPRSRDLGLCTLAQCYKYNIKIIISSNSIMHHKDETTDLIYYNCLNKI